MSLMKACYALKRTVLVSPRVQEIMLSSANQVILDDAPLLEMRADGMTLGQKIIKRGTDIVLSALALLVLSPLMLLIALAIRVEDGGNVIFRQKRLTTDGKTFTICKFRTMRRGSGGTSARDADDRVTHVGVSCAGGGWMSCRSSGTFCAGICRWSAHARKCWKTSHAISVTCRNFSSGNA